MADPVRHELADFEPSNGHLHTCNASVDAGYTAPGQCECAALLFCVAQDLEAEIRRRCT